MLASSAATVADAFARLSPAVVEWKIDGIRIQVHRAGTDVAVFTRTLDDITIRVPEITEAVLALDVRAAVFDGEAVALAPDGRPAPVPGHREPHRQSHGRRAPARGHPADPVLLRPAAPGRHGPDRRARARQAGQAGGRDARAPARPAPGHRGRRRRRGVLRRRGRARPRGRGGQVAGCPVRGRAARQRVDQGEATAHARPGGARGRMGPRPAPRLAVQPAPGRA